MDNQEPTHFQPEPSLHPGKLAFQFLVPRTRMRQDMMPTPYVTTYANCLLPNKVKMQEGTWRDYVFTDLESYGADHLAFRFVPVITDTERETPIAGGSVTTWEKHPWDNWLVQLGAIEDDTQPLNVIVDNATVEIARLFGRYFKVPGGLYTSRIRVDTYVSHEEFPADMLNDVLSPVPTEVRWSHRNLQGSMECLHDLIEFEETQTSGAVLDGWGTVNNPLIMGDKSVFPATNPPGWTSHYFKAEQTMPMNGMRRLTKYWVDVPEAFEEIQNAAL